MSDHTKGFKSTEVVTRCHCLAGCSCKADAEMIRHRDYVKDNITLVFICTECGCELYLIGEVEK